MIIFSIFITTDINTTVTFSMNSINICERKINMIAEIIRLLGQNEFYGCSQNVEIAKENLR
jgi:hypothetical protein